MKYLPFIFILLVTTFGFSCSLKSKSESDVIRSNTDSGQIKKESQSINVQLTFQIENLEARKPKIVGQTNLPEGTQLGAWIKGESINYNAQDKFTVFNGKFESGEFGFNNKELPIGKYKVDITMPISQIQTETVRKIIGENGENLKGDLVEDSTLGRVVRTTQEFQIERR